MIRSMSVGTTPMLAVQKFKRKLSDVIIYNNSANTVYVLESDTQSASDGIPIPLSGGYYWNNACRKTLWVVASGLASDVRIDFDYFVSKLREFEEE